MKAKQFEDDAAVKVHRIRITLTSRNVKNLEKGAQPASASLARKCGSPPRISWRAPPPPPRGP